MSSFLWCVHVSFFVMCVCVVYLWSAGRASFLLCVCVLCVCGLQNVYVELLVQVHWCVFVFLFFNEDDLYVCLCVDRVVFPHAHTQTQTHTHTRTHMHTHT